MIFRKLKQINFQSKVIAVTLFLKIFKIILINFIVFIGILLFLECLVRISVGGKINYQGSSSNLLKDSVYFDSYGLAPGITGYSHGAKITVNSYGLRGPEVNFNKQKKNILLIGDSVLMGVGLPDSCTISSYFLNSIQDSSYQILNTGVMGYSIYDYLNVLRVWVDKLDIKCLFLFYCLNDVYRVNKFDQKVIKIQKHRDNLIIEKTLNFFRCYSKLYLFLKNILFKRGNAYYLYDYRIYKDDKERIREGMGTIQLIQSICKDNGIDFNFVILPYKYQYTNISSDSWYPQNLVKKYLSTSDINIIDLRYVFQNEKDISNFYLYGDPIHFSKLGTFKIVKAIYDLDLY